MRRILQILSFLLALTQFVMAQSSNLGISLGANFSNLIGPGKIDGSKPRLGFCPGLVLDIPTAYESYLELGLLYSQQGVTIKDESYDRFEVRQYMTDYEYQKFQNKTIRFKTNISKHVDYITFPVMWKQSFGGLYGKVGPWVSFAVQAESEKKVSVYVGTDTIIKYSSSSDTTAVGKAFNQSFINQLRKYDMGGGISVGYQTSIGQSFDLFIDASYKIGFFSVEDQPTDRKSVIRNQYFTVSAGVFLVKNRRSRTFRRR